MSRLWRTPFFDGNDCLTRVILLGCFCLQRSQDLRLTTRQKHLSGFRQIFDDMKPVGALYGLGSALGSGRCKWKMKIATAATFIFRIQPTLSNFLVSWLKPSFMTESTPCGFHFWPPQDIRIRKQGCYLRTAQSYSLIVQSKHHLSHFSALLHHPLFRSFSTIDLILSGDLGTFVRESTDKELFTHFKSAGNVTYWEWSDFSIKYSFDELLHETNIPFRSRHPLFVPSSL